MARASLYVSLLFHGYYNFLVRSVSGRTMVPIASVKFHYHTTEVGYSFHSICGPGSILGCDRPSSSRNGVHVSHL
jgi:hypothetical protein